MFAMLGERDDGPIGDRHNQIHGLMLHELQRGLDKSLDILGGHGIGKTQVAVSRKFGDGKYTWVRPDGNPVPGASCRTRKRQRRRTVPIEDQYSRQKSPLSRNRAGNSPSLHRPAGKGPLQIPAQPINCLGWTHPAET